MRSKGRPTVGYTVSPTGKKIPIYRETAPGHTFPASWLAPAPEAVKEALLLRIVLADVGGKG